MKQNSYLFDNFGIGDELYEIVYYPWYDVRCKCEYGIKGITGTILNFNTSESKSVYIKTNEGLYIIPHDKIKSMEPIK